jgi:beta-ureidopropionase
VPTRLMAPTKYPFATACAGCSSSHRYSESPATVADGLNTISAPFKPKMRAPSGKCLWELEQPAHAVANGYFVGAINRVGTEKPWSIGEFYGKSYFCNPRGKIIAQASRDKDEVVIADLDLDMIAEVRKVWQFFRDRRPDTYGPLTTQSSKSVAAD